MKRREEKYLKHLWNMFCGKENSQEEHYFVDEDNLKMYRKLTDMHTDELIKWEEITNPETIISVYELSNLDEKDEDPIVEHDGMRYNPVTLEDFPPEPDEDEDEDEDTEEETLHSARLREAGISNDYYENGDEFDEGDSSYDEHYN